jgi:hypothetical protein
VLAQPNNGAGAKCAEKWPLLAHMLTGSRRPIDFYCNGGRTWERECRSRSLTLDLSIFYPGRVASPSPLRISTAIVYAHSAVSIFAAIRRVVFQTTLSASLGFDRLEERSSATIQRLRTPSSSSSSSTNSNPDSLSAPRILTFSSLRPPTTTANISFRLETGRSRFTLVLHPCRVVSSPPDDSRHPTIVTSDSAQFSFYRSLTSRDST